MIENLAESCLHRALVVVFPQPLEDAYVTLCQAIRLGRIRTGEGVEDVIFSGELY